MQRKEMRLVRPETHFQATGSVGLHELANIAHKLHDGRPDLAVFYDEGFRGVRCRGRHGALEMRPVLASTRHSSSTPLLKQKRPLFGADVPAKSFMSRLASFRGPSTPSPSPVHAKQPSSPSLTTESTYHRKTRLYLQELRTISDTWDDLVLVDGVKAAKSLVDARTDLEYTVSLILPLIDPLITSVQQ